MLCSYCDEFGHADDPTKRVMGVAGLLARTEAWAQFVSEWDSICDEEHVPKPFHMVDFVHQKEDFKIGWESEEKRLRVLEATGDTRSSAATICHLPPRLIQVSVQTNFPVAPFFFFQPSLPWATAAVPVEADFDFIEVIGG